MQTVLAFGITAVIIGAGIWYGIQTLASKRARTTTPAVAEITADAQAIELVRARSEVAEYLAQTPDALIVVDNFDEETNEYLVHVYEIVEDHTATFNWYIINRATGSIQAQF